MNSGCDGKPAVANRGASLCESVVLSSPGYEKGVPIGVDMVKNGHPDTVKGGMSPSDETGMTFTDT